VQRSVCPECGRPDGELWQSEACAINHPGSLALALGITPPSAVVNMRGLDGDIFGSRWASWKVHILALSIGHLPEPWDGPLLQFNGAVLQAWLIRVSEPAIGAYIERRWHPQHGNTLALHGLEKIKKLKDAQWFLGASLRLMNQVSARGRKPLRKREVVERRKIVADSYEYQKKYPGLKLRDIAASFLGVNYNTLKKYRGDPRFRPKA
jgi:hypothetical protein